MSNDFESRLRRSLPADTAPELSPDIIAGASSRTAPRLGNPARRLQVASGLTVAVAAVAIGAMVVTLPTQQAPLFTAGGSGGATSMSSAEGATSDMRIANWVNYEYVAGAGLSTSGGSGSVYELQRTGTPEQRAMDVAAALDLDGSAVKSQYFDPAYPSYVVGPEDGTAPTVYVTWSGTGNWSYNNPAATPPISCDAEGVCDMPTPTLADSLAPSSSEAADLAHDLFAATGLDIAADKITVTVDEWQTSATGNLVVDGVSTAIDYGVAWSAATGELSYAWGHSISVVDRGSYGTVSPTAAVDRLTDWRWFGSAGPEYQSGMSTFATDLARGSDVTTTEGPVSDAPVSDAPFAGAPVTEVPTDSPTALPGEVPSVDPSVPVDPSTPVEPAPTEDPILVDPIPTELPTPETVVVTLDSADATLLLMWDSEGNAWLVPGFAFKQPEGWWNSVVSLEEGVIELPAPVEMLENEPYAVDPEVIDD